MDVTPSPHPPKTNDLQNSSGVPKKLDTTIINKIQTITDIKLENADIILSMDVSICNRQMRFLVDSGAHASMLKSSCLKSNVLYYPQIRYCMVGINGPNNSIQTHGATFGNITINNINLKQQFQIAGDNIHMSYDGILGMDFLLFHKAIMDLENMKLSILLPISHNLYEADERHMFEKTHPKSKK